MSQSFKTKTNSCTLRDPWALVSSFLKARCSCLVSPEIYRNNSNTYVIQGNLLAAWKSEIENRYREACYPIMRRTYGCIVGCNFQFENFFCTNSRNKHTKILNNYMQWSSVCHPHLAGNKVRSQGWFHGGV